MAQLILAFFAVCLLCIYAEGNEDCGPNEVLEPCGKSCEPTCIYPFEKACRVDDTCLMECRCEETFLRNEDGECVETCPE